VELLRRWKADAEAEAEKKLGRARVSGDGEAEAKEKFGRPRVSRSGGSTATARVLLGVLAVCLLVSCGLYFVGRPQSAPPTQEAEDLIDDDRTVLELVAEYQRMLQQLRGYVTAQAAIVNGLTDLGAWKRAKVDGTLRRLQALQRSQQAWLASSETMEVVGSFETISSQLNNLVQGPTPDDIVLEAARKRWSELTYALGRSGPLTDAQVGEWRLASLRFMYAHVQVLNTKERLVTEAAQEWAAQQAVPIAAAAQSERR
jgi:hypothetical protein